jgi:hypothetical protein
VTSTLVGATKLAQLSTNLAALGETLSPEHAARLDAASELPSIHPYQYFGPPFTGMVNGAPVQGWHGQR